MTVGELKKVLEKIEDDVEVIAASNNYELLGKFSDAHVYLGKFKRVNEQFRDDFDNNYYSKEVYRMDKRGKEFVAIFGD